MNFSMKKSILVGLISCGLALPVFAQRGVEHRHPSHNHGRDVAAAIVLGTVIYGIHQTYDQRRLPAVPVAPPAPVYYPSYSSVPYLPANTLICGYNFNCGNIPAPNMNCYVSPVFDINGVMLGVKQYCR